ncbi:MAG: tetratricopeptide repeat protein, partial [Saprospiraceae bacterium]|nr:tetratricopeptide repeat protein [Saprospiraceae bacterium]
GLLAAAIGFFLYANTFGYNYTLDDFSSIKDNWVVKGGLKNVGIIFSTEYRFGTWNSPGSLYRPIPLAMFAFEWQMAPDKPFISHVFNVGLYAFTGWMLWITWRRILVNYPPVLPALATLFFMAHPIHTEVVCNIKSRDEIMAFLFGTISMYAIWKYLENKKVEWMAAALISYGISMFSKEGAIMFIFIFPMTLWFFTNRPLGEIARISAWMVAPAAIFLMVRHQVLAAQQYDEVYSILDNFIVGAKNSAERLASAFMMCGKYLWVLIFPHPLVCDMGYPQVEPVGFSEWKAVVGFLVYLAMGIWALLNFGKKHILSYAIFFYLICFSLFSNVFFLIGTSYGERLQYMPSFGFTIAMAWGICKMFKIDDMASIWNPNGKGNGLWTLAGIILALYAFKTISRNPAWENSATLYASDLPTSPNCAKLNYHNALEVARVAMDEKSGVVKDRAGLEKAVECYSKCIKLYPEYHDAFGGRGIAYFRLGQYDKAFEDYQVSLKHRPNNAPVLSNMGYIYFMRGQLDKAEEVYKESIKYDPRFVDARRNLGAVLAMKKQFPEAIQQWEEGLKFEPNNATLLFYIGSAYKDMGQPEKAGPWLDRAYAADPSLRK